MEAVPQHVLVHVLQRINQTDRLKSCALVSTAWAEAAAMATADFKCCASDPATFQPWLQHHGSHVTSICCGYSGENKEEDDYLRSWAQEKDVKPELRELHCTNLMKLALYDWAVQLDGPLLQAATGITYLDLHMLNKHDFGYDFHNTLWWSRRGGLNALAALEDLQALQRFDLSVGETLAIYNPNDRDQLPSRVIRSWSTSLTRLSFSGVLALESYEPFSRFVKLQHLYMDLRLGVQEASAESAQQPFAQLQALTFLSLCMEEHHKRAQASSSLPLSGCSELQELHLYSPSLDAVTLEGLTGLHRLYVSLPALEESGAACFGAVLSDIGHMLHLERLVLSAGFHCETVTLDSGIAELCTALTASGQLSYLDLSGLKLPRSALVHLFPNGRQLPQLHEFKLSFANASTYDDFLDCSALEQMVVCCPAITRLGFGDLSVFKRDVSLVPLLQLRQLADLECPFVMDGASSVGVLARLSSLTRLHLQPSPEGDAAYRLTDESMLQLTALTRLQELGLQHHPWQQHCQGHGLSMMGGHWKITLKPTRGSRSDVWYQLLLACASTADCQASLDKQLPNIIQQRQDSGHSTAAFELALGLGRAQARIAEAHLALAEAKESEDEARARLQEMLAADGQPYVALWDRAWGQPLGY